MTPGRLEQIRADLADSDRRHPHGPYAMRDDLRYLLAHIDAQDRLLALRDTPVGILESRILRALGILGLVRTEAKEQGSGYPWYGVALVMDVLKGKHDDT